MYKVAIIDYKLNNLGSVKRAIEECGANALITDSPEQLKNATHIILPGVGAFGDAMQNLKDQNMLEELYKNVKISKIPFLGICLGMQLLATVSAEFGTNYGLNLIRGEIIRFDQESTPRVPHIGWNSLNIKVNTNLFNNIPDQSDFYFVHSYYFKLQNPDHLIATTDYGNEFAAVIRDENIIGAQFHPEKSGRHGFQFLKNFLNF